MSPLKQFFAAVGVGSVTIAISVMVALPALGGIAGSIDGADGPLDISAFEDFDVRSQVFASDGSLIATLQGVENREPVPLEQIPDTVKWAILAVEDAEFYQHGGINIRALFRAALANVQAGEVDQGGSTITQQLVKKALLSDDRVLNRKTKEAALALKLESQIDKDEILSLYMNTVYFGSGAYGVQAAAETYWGKNVQDLGWAEGAMLAALIANPVAHDPIVNPETATVRRTQAIGRMLEAGVIDEQQAEQALATPLPVGRCSGADGPRPADCGEVVLPPPDSYFVETVKLQLLADPRLGDTYEERFRAVFGGGLRIHTTLDPIAQAAAQDAHDNTFPEAVRADADARGITTAMVSVESSTGAVRAVVGGPGFEQFKYDIATLEPGRQTGSTFKTFVLLTALEQGVQPNDPVGGGGAWPNPGGSPDPYVISGAGGTLQSVTAGSSNGAFVRLGQTVGLDNVVEVSERLGVTSQFDPRSKSMPLGVFDVTPLEMASAYSAIPNGGIRQAPYYIERVESRLGEVLIEHRANPSRAVSANTACLATEILETTVTSGTGRNAQLGSQPAAGKTGTTESNSNTWFVGFTPYLTTAVWMGIPEEGNKPMGNLGGQEQFGGLWPATIWRNFNRAWLDGTQRPVAQFPSCNPLGRAPKPAAGADDPYGILNGGALPEDTTTTTAPTSTTRPRSTLPPTTRRSTTTTRPTTSSTTSTTTTTVRPPGGNGGDLSP